MQQRTAEWFQARTGCLTASRASIAFARGAKGQKLKAYWDLIDEIVAERITGECVQHFTTDAMKWGVEHEDNARLEYCVSKGVAVDEVGFVRHPSIANFGASPDGLVGEDGLLEIKCPTTVTHLKYVRDAVVPDQYKPQMLVQLLCTGRAWCDFFSYDPRLEAKCPHLAKFCVRYVPKPEELEKALELSSEFLSDVDSALKELGLP